jgi:hypothetical protein
MATERKIRVQILSSVSIRAPVPYTSPLCSATVILSQILEELNCEPDH